MEKSTRCLVRDCMRNRNIIIPAREVMTRCVKSGKLQVATEQEARGLEIPLYMKNGRIEVEIKMLRYGGTISLGIYLSL